MSRVSGLHNPSSLKPSAGHGKRTVRVVIETPKGSRNKYAFDADEKVFVLKKVLPTGMDFLTTSASFRRRSPKTGIRSTSSCSWTSLRSQAASSNAD